MCLLTGGWWVNWPVVKKGQIQMDNPKDDIGSGIGKADALVEQLNSVIDLGYAYMFNGSLDDVVEGLSLPAYMIKSAVDSWIPFRTLEGRSRTRRNRKETR
jgi:hypothetical protein